MKIKKLVLGILLLSSSLNLFSQETEWIETKAVIKNIEIKGTKRAKEFATISFVSQKGDTIESQIELLRLPILGSFKSVGDTVDVHYDKNTPHKVESLNEGFINKYGWYVLIGLGIIFSIKPFLSRNKK